MVVVVRTVVRPRLTRAGDASTLIQNETHEIITINIVGTNSCTVEQTSTNHIFLVKKVVLSL